MTDIEKAIHSMYNLNMVLSITESERCAVNLAIQALQEKAERDKGCEGCNKEWGIPDPKTNRFWKQDIKLCPMCGKELGE